MIMKPWVSNTIKAGQKYGRLTVISTHCIEGTYRYMAYCQCDCGSKPLYIRIDALRCSESKSGGAKSCGCLQRERVTTHGAWGHPIFHIWSAMMRRCYNPKDSRYSEYGGRGITVCDEWHDVNKFIDDMFPYFQQGLQIDRKDNYKGYSPDNCRWATRTQQARNKRTNVRITYRGETHCLSE
jgi:hypothetical protein